MMLVQNIVFTKESVPKPSLGTRIWRGGWERGNTFPYLRFSGELVNIGSTLNISVNQHSELSHSRTEFGNENYIKNINGVLA